MRTYIKIGKREDIFRKFGLSAGRIDEPSGREEERVTIALRRTVQKTEAPEHLIEAIRREIRK